MNCTLRCDCATKKDLELATILLIIAICCLWFFSSVTALVAMRQQRGNDIPPVPIAWSHVHEEKNETDRPLQQ